MEQLFDFYHNDRHYVAQVNQIKNECDGEDETIIYILKMNDSETGTLVCHSHAIGHPNAKGLAEKAFKRYIEYVSMTPEQMSERRKKSDELKAEAKKRIRHG